MSEQAQGPVDVQVEQPDPDAPRDHIERQVEEPALEAPLDLDSSPGGLRGALEAVLMVIDEPASDIALASALGVPVPTVSQTLHELAHEYEQQTRGYTLRSFGGGWRFYSRAEYAPLVEHFLMDGQQARLTQASLETLAVIAYRQPVSRSRVGAVRGVNVDGVVRTLVARGLVEEVGEQDETGAVLYGTTGYFLQRLGLDCLDDLPALAPYLPEMDALDELAQQGHS